MKKQTDQNVIIIGLGNPGPKYKNTRHNVGFIVLDQLAGQLSVSFSEQKKFNAEVAAAPRDEKKLFLVKPETFMNNSGQAAAAITQFHKAEKNRIIIIHDEIDLPFGKIRISRNSGAAGHRGVESILNALGKGVARLRIGIDNRPDKKKHPTDAYVMAKFSAEEQKELNESIVPEALKILQLWLSEKNNTLDPTSELKVKSDKPILP